MERAAARRILLVDDHEVVRTGLRYLLTERTDWSVCGEASNGEEAIAKVIELKPDLVILDVTMPVLGGIQAAREIRQLAPQTKILMLSMHDSAQVTRTLAAAGTNADACVSKAAPREKLMSTVSALLNGHQPARASIDSLEKNAVSPNPSNNPPTEELVSLRTPLSPPNHADNS